MGVRLASRHDIPKLLEIVEDYAFEQPIGKLKDTTNHLPDHVEQLLFGIICGRGFIYVDDEMRGAIIAYKTKNIWSPNVMELHELLWWVKPEARSGTLGGRLWMAFDSKATAMLEKGEIDYICTSLAFNGPEINYAKRGYKPLNASFVRE